MKQLCLRKKDMIEYELRGGNKMIKLRLKEKGFGRVTIIVCAPKVIIVTVCNSLKRKKQDTTEDCKHGKSSINKLH